MTQSIPHGQTLIDEPQEQSHIHFDSQLLGRKKQIIEEFIRNQDESQDCLTKYPNEQLQKMASQQIKVHGKLLLFKSAATVYFGQTCNDLYHGQGLLIYKSNFVRFYEGHFQNNCKYGYGLEYINGDVYIGKFLNNKPEDDNGIFIWNNGDIYHGAFVNGMKHGNGKWQSGDQFYSGSWKFNKPEGQGYIKSALSEYNGDVKNGYKHGHGIELFNNGDRYDGIYSNGKPEGQGTYAWSNGSIYKGQFKNGLRFGYGVWQYGSEKYEGSYINDKRNGEGTYSWSGGSYYKGIFMQDLRHGFGQMHWDKGSYYRGEWFEGVQQGDGQIWDKGQIIEKGYFQKGKLKVFVPNQQSQRKFVHGPVQPIKKVQTQKNSSILPTFEEKKRFNSFHGTRNEIVRLPNPRTQRIIHQSFTSKQNEILLQKKREINKRYSMLDKFSERRGMSQAVKLPLKKSPDNSAGKINGSKSKERQQKTESKTSIMKIQLYKKLRKQRKTQPINKKLTTANRLHNSFEGQVMFETQLAPIKWKNFGHVGSH